MSKHCEITEQNLVQFLLEVLKNLPYHRALSCPQGSLCNSGEFLVETPEGGLLEKEPIKNFCIEVRGL